MAKKVLIIAGSILVLLIVVALALPMFIDANKFKLMLETDITTALGRKVEIGNISLSILAGGVTVDNISIADDPTFSPSPFLTAKELKVGVALLPLIFSKRLEVESFTVTVPQVTLLRSAGGKWNFSSLGANASKSKEAKSPDSSETNLSVAKLKISNGALVVGNTATPGKTRRYENVDLEASGFFLYRAVSVQSDREDARRGQREAGRQGRSDRCERRRADSFRCDHWRGKRRLGADRLH